MTSQTWPHTPKRPFLARCKSSEVAIFTESYLPDQRSFRAENFPSCSSIVSFMQLQYEAICQQQRGDTGRQTGQQHRVLRTAATRRFLGKPTHKYLYLVKESLFFSLVCFKSYYNCSAMLAIAFDQPYALLSLLSKP